MEYTFSWGWFFIGLLILAAGAAMVVWYRQIADNFAGGAGSYDRTRLWGVVACVLVLVCMLNLHSIILGAIFSQLFSGGNN